MSKLPKIYVIAHTQVQFDSFLRWNQLDPRLFVRAMASHHLLGARSALILLPSCAFGFDDIVPALQWWRRTSGNSIFLVSEKEVESHLAWSDELSALLTPYRTEPVSGRILPCPFCGGDDIRFTNHGKSSRAREYREDDVWSTGCYDCGATFPNRYRKELLVACWNRRPAKKQKP